MADTDTYWSHLRNGVVALAAGRALTYGAISNGDFIEAFVSIAAFAVAIYHGIMMLKGIRD